MSPVYSSTRQTPFNRYLIRTTRKVDRDRTISHNGMIYEAMIPLIDKTITLLYHQGDSARIEAVHEGISHGMLVPWI